MRKLFWILAISSITLLSSCNLIEGIFKAGAYTGIFIVLVIIALIIWILSRFRGRS